MMAVGYLPHSTEAELGQLYLEILVVDQTTKNKKPALFILAVFSRDFFINIQQRIIIQKRITFIIFYSKMN